MKNSRIKLTEETRYIVEAYLEKIAARREKIKKVTKDEYVYDFRKLKKVD